MRQDYRAARLLAAAVTVILAGFVLAGCQEKTPPPSAPGYYEGQRQGKGEATVGNDAAPKPSQPATK